MNPAAASNPWLRTSESQFRVQGWDVLRLLIRGAKSPRVESIHTNLWFVRSWILQLCRRLTHGSPRLSDFAPESGQR